MNIDAFLGYVKLTKLDRTLSFCPVAAAATVLVASSFPTNALAQSSVTLYGSIDLGVSFASNVGGSHQYRMSNGVEGPTRWGMTGREDLGGGLGAVFKLESGFNAANGSLGGGLAFNRQAYVGIQDERLGTLTVGRQWSPATDLVSSFSLNALYGGWYFSHPNDIDNLDYSFSIPNAVKYVSPKLGGATVEALYAFGGQAGQFSNNSVYSGAASWAGGAFAASIGYLRVYNPQTTVIGYQSGGGFVNAVYGTYLLNARSQDIFAAGVSYTLGPVKLLGNFTNVNFREGDAGQDVKFQNYEAAAVWSVAPDLFVYGGYTYTDGRNHATDQRPKYQQVNLGANYQLSKRTGLYAIASLQKASGGAVAQIAGFNPSSNSKQVAGHIGINHYF